MTLLAVFATPAAVPGGEVLWHDPGPVEKLDFASGPGGNHMRPRPPFYFIEEDLSGSYPKVKVHDARGRVWSVKFGREVRAEPFASRIAWAAGYFVEPIYFVPRGIIRGVHGLKRAAKSIGIEGEFRDARFQLRDPAIKFMDDANWSWTYNPFFGTRELNGLKVVIILTSNWDNKDARDVDEGINTAIFERRRSGPRYLYAFTDWGGSMGHWGNYFRRTVWNCEHFTEDSQDFIKGVKSGRIEWGYHGRHSGEFLRDIRVDDVAWIMRYIGRIQDSQLRSGLIASGATPAETDCFVGALRRRIETLRMVATSSRPSAHPVSAR
jgi:hypothetical protein